MGVPSSSDDAFLLSSSESLASANDFVARDRRVGRPLVLGEVRVLGVLRRFDAMGISLSERKHNEMRTGQLVTEKMGHLRNIWTYQSVFVSRRFSLLSILVIPPPLSPPNSQLLIHYLVLPLPLRRLQNDSNLPAMLFL